MVMEAEITLTVDGQRRTATVDTRVTLLDLIELFEDVGSTAAASTGVRTAEGRALARVLAEIAGMTRATLGSVTLATLLQIGEREPPARRVRGNR